VEVVSEFDELIMCPIHVGGLACFYAVTGWVLNDDQQSRVAAAIPRVFRTGFPNLPRRASLW
jgi:hypothetical protein